MQIESSDEKNEVLHIDHSNILNFLKVRPPYIFVDQADVIPGKSATSTRTFTYNEWFFACHLPDDPIVPAVFLLEAIIQTAALPIHAVVPAEKGKIYAKKFDCNVINAVRPGETLFVETEISNFKRGIVSADGRAFVYKSGKKIHICSAQIQMILPQMLTSLTPNKDN